MERFLEGVAKELYSKHGSNIARLTLIFPSKRAGLFFSRYLGKLISKPIFSPEIITINEFIVKFSSIKIGDRLPLLMRLYSIYIDKCGSDESFDSFYYWGVMLISDFDDIDKYLVDVKALYGNIEEIKDIDAQFSFLEPEQVELLKRFWVNVGGLGLSVDGVENIERPENSSFTSIWGLLYDLYLEFNASLKGESIGYEGLVYRDVIDNIESCSELDDFIHNGGEQRHIAVVGLNALNRCEERFLQHLKSRADVSFFWDYDKYYLDDKMQEAGLFMRRNLELFPNSATLYSTDSMRSSKRSIDIVSIPSNIGQVKPVASFIKEHTPSPTPFDDSAVILCDESLLIPMLSAVPSSIDKVNVTMGYPIKNSPIYSLIKQIIALHQRSTISKRGDVEFYHRDVISILEHQLLVIYSQDSGVEELFNNFRRDVVKYNHLRLLETQFNLGDELLSAIFKRVDTIPQITDYFKTVLRVLHRTLHNRKESDSDGEDSSYDYNSEFVSTIYHAFNRFGDLIVSEERALFGSSGVITPSVYFKLLDIHIRELSLPFEGDPLEGFQVMGILESRALDFKNLVLVSMNDDVMPGKGNVSNSYIPYHLRRAFGLPSIEEKGAMYAYYFYRLIQRAENVRIIYNSSSSGLSTGEKSRYIYQLQCELGSEQAESGGLTVPINEVEEEMLITSVKSRPIEIPKSEGVVLAMQKFLDGTRALSPSAINRYLECEMRFFFQDIAGVKEPDRVEEQIDARLFGNIFHKAAELIYRPYIGKIMTASTLEAIVNDDALITDVIYKSFKDEYFEGRDGAIEGKNILIEEIIREYLIKLLRVDIDSAPIDLVGMEESFYTTIPIFDNRSEVKVGGLIDRYDVVGGKFRVIDYKSGEAEFIFDTIPSLFDSSLKRRNKAALQTLIYSRAYFDSCRRLQAIAEEDRDVTPGIYQLKSLFADDFSPYLTCKMSGDDDMTYRAVADEFTSELTSLLERIFSLENSFCQTKELDRCSYCTYNQLCKLS